MAAHAWRDSAGEYQDICHLTGVSHISKGEAFSTYLLGLLALYRVQ